MNRPSMDWKPRFWAKVKKTPGCWLWTGHTDRIGYGRFWKDGESRLAHVVIWEEKHGPVPEDGEVCHTCDVPNCVKEDHLVLGDHFFNMKDKSLKNRQYSHLSQVQMGEVRQLLPTLSNKEIAVRFRVPRQCIADIRRGRSGKHAQGAIQ